MFRGYEEWRWKHRKISPDVLSFEQMYLKAVHKAKLQDAAGAERGVSLKIRVDVNKATRNQLIRLPGIGPKMAKRIISYRNIHGPFKTKRDLLKIKGIGEKKLKVIEPYLE